MMDIYSRASLCRVEERVNRGERRLSISRELLHRFDPPRFVHVRDGLAHKPVLTEILKKAS